ncbi:MAG: iron-sulfur cluster-binding protein [Coxiella sp. RIFCSPHIGHO2_12_FULL_44_14]|nr:MAG: iron-sulfur cluster-binding protein [Coxiella sp. RIFCSPHIGHO2_12_FULL_44_14]
MTQAVFHRASQRALNDNTLQRALGHIQAGFVVKRALAKERLPEFDAIRENAVAIKNHTLQHLDYYLEVFADRVEFNGGRVHWAEDASEACEQVLAICHAVNARHVVKSKSMLTEEIELNVALEKAGLSVTETDLGEYIIQQRGEKPSHIVAPAIHLLKEQVAETFYRCHSQFPADRSLSEAQRLLSEARHVLREKYFLADVGITGANFLIAETGAAVMVTNEGNGDLVRALSRVHIVIASIEKVLPTVEDTMQLLRLLPRSATGQEITAYVTFSMGPRRSGDWGGPEQFHVILVDNGRSHLLGSALQEMLRCIRCGACLNHCPVYQAIGGQAYGSVYPGPMGAVLTPALVGIEKHHDLPNASTFCGRCETVCPVHIPLPQMMRHYRAEAFKKRLGSRRSLLALKVWAFLSQHPGIYQASLRVMSRLLRLWAGGRSRVQYLPFARGWTHYRDFPIPTQRTFQQWWAEQPEKTHHE